MVYLDITIEGETKALTTLEEEESSKVEKKWKDRDESLREFCGLPAKRSQEISRPFLFCTACKSERLRKRFGCPLDLDI